MPTPTALPSAFTAGDVLTAANMNGLLGGFRILQLVVAEMDTSQSSTSVTFVDITGSSVTITPQAATNKVLLVLQTGCFVDLNACGINVRLLRGATNIYTELCFEGSAANQAASVVNMQLDSPATTSPITYKAQFARRSGPGTALINAGSPSMTSRLLVAEISA